MWNSLLEIWTSIIAFTLYKHLYLWSDYRTKNVWSKFLLWSIIFPFVHILFLFFGVEFFHSYTDTHIACLPYSAKLIRETVVQFVWRLYSWTSCCKRVQLNDLTVLYILRQTMKNKKEYRITKALWILSD